MQTPYLHLDYSGHRSPRSSEQYQTLQSNILSHGLVIRENRQSKSESIFVCWFIFHCWSKLSIDSRIDANIAGNRKGRGSYLISRVNMSLLQVQGLRLIQLGRSGPRAGLRCSKAREGTYSSAGRDRDFDIFGTTGENAFR